MYRLTSRQSAAFLIASTNPVLDGESLVMSVPACGDPDSASGRQAFLEHLGSHEEGDWESAAQQFTGESGVPSSATLADGQMTVLPGKDAGRPVGKRSSAAVDAMIPQVLSMAAVDVWRAATEGAPLSLSHLIHKLPEYAERFRVVVVRVL